MKHFKTLLLSCWALPGFHQFTQQAVEHHFRIVRPFPSIELEDRRDFFRTPGLCVEK